jgi:hypothetical protein
MRKISDICDRFLRGDETLDDNDKAYAAVLVEKREAARENAREYNKIRYQNDAEKLREQRKQLRLGGDCDSDLVKEKQDEWRSRKKRKSDGQVYPDSVPEIHASGTYLCPRVRVNMVWNDKFGFFTGSKPVRVRKPVKDRKHVKVEVRIHPSFCVCIECHNAKMAAI